MQSLRNEAKLIGGGVVGSGTIGGVLSVLQATGRPFLMLPSALLGTIIMALWVLTVDDPPE